jgi:hypothetical protein
MENLPNWESIRAAVIDSYLKEVPKALIIKENYTLRHLQKEL